MNPKYILIKKRPKNKAVCIEKGYKLEGLMIKPLNKIKYDGIVVHSMVVLKPCMIDNILKKKIEKKLDMHLKYIVEDASEDDSDDTTGLIQSKNEIDKLRNLLEFKYRKYLEDQYVDRVLKKLSLLYNEVESKINYKLQREYLKKQIFSYDSDIIEEKKGKSR